MSTNERKQANFSVSHVWPEMIDIKCCNCKKFSESLKNGEFEKSGEKSYIIKKQVTCNCCGASAPAGTELEEVYVDADRTPLPLFCRYMRSSTQFASYSLPSAWLMIIIRARLFFCYSVLY